MKRLLVIFRSWLRNRFNLDEDKADEPEIIRSIRRNVEFKGANLWTLLFAILIASIGLNVNSTAVIIGAMLISPLMGPIMGVGLGIGINDLGLIKSGMKNLLIAAFFSIITSTLYFWITPLREAQSEILSRTTPSLWDVFIAFFGGLAGIVAGTRREKTNVIPGVAIATALMPPLCTAGFGLANGFIFYFLGAIYLFFINSVFICISTFLIVRFLNFQKKEFEDKLLERRVSRTILWIVIITILPSIYLAYKIVDKSIFETNGRKFVAMECRFSTTQVVDETFSYADGKKEIDLLLIGEELSPKTQKELQGKLRKYNLEDAGLIIRQGLKANREIDFSAIKASILKDVFAKTDTTSVEDEGPVEELPDITKELLVLYPDLLNYSLTPSVIRYNDTLPNDTMIVALVNFKEKVTAKELGRLRAWLTTRINADTVKLLVE